MATSDAQLYQLLADIEYLSSTELEQAKAHAAAEQVSLYDYLLQHDLVSDENLGRLVADSLKLPFVSLSQMQIPEAVLKLAPRELAETYQLITFGLDDKGLRIATTNPEATDLFLMLTKKAGARECRLFYATQQDIAQTLQLYKQELSAAFASLLQTKGGNAATIPVAKIVNTIIEYAYDSKASDIHIEPTRTACVVRFRIDGVLHDVVSLPQALHEQIIARVKVLARLRTDEHFSAQDGRMHMELEKESLDVRVSTVPIVSGEKAVMRLLASHFRQFGLTDLGMSPADLAKLQAGFGRSYGMVLSTGPTGSGKTTSMYAVLKILNVREKNIATIEDPVEYEISGLNQIQANPKTNLTFANGLRSILRQDPDIIYVGEIRDEETADIAINSAMTGHLVLSTLHTNDAATTLPRLIDMKIEPFLVSSTVNTIIGQRLVRKICDRCKVSIELTKGKTGWTGDARLATELASLSPEVVSQHFGDGTSLRLYRGKGCPVCHGTGYIGRVGIFEILEVSPAIQTLIIQKANADQIATVAKQEGMTTMMDDGLAKAAGGITTVSEILRATRE